MVKPWDAKTRRTVPWSQTEKEKLLARHLYTVTELSKNPVKPKADKVIREVSLRLKPQRSQRQVKRKLEACLREYSTPGQPFDYDRFHLQGSRMLTRIPHNVINSIDAEYRAIQAAELKSLKASPLSTRSASRRLQDSKRKQKDHSSISRSCTPRTPTRRQQRPQAEDSAQLIKTEPPTSKVLHTRDTSSKETVLISQPPTPSRSVETSQLVGVYVDTETSHVQENSEYGFMRHQDSLWASSSFGTAEIQYNKDWSNEQIDQAFAQGQINLYDMFRDNVVLRERVSILENDVAEHQRRQRVQQSLHDAHQQFDEMIKLRQVLDETDRELSQYKQQDHSREMYESSIDSSSCSVRSLLANSLRSISNELALAMDNISRYGISLRDVGNEAFLSSPDLVSLSNRTFGAHQLETVLRKAQEMAQNSSITILQSLVGAAVCEWVLCERLQWMATISSPLLESWRRQAAAIWGRDAAFAVDSLAHRSLFEKGEFASDRISSVMNDYEKAFVVQATEKLVDRFLRTVQPILSQSGLAGSFTELLRSIFYHALKMKTVAVSRGYRVEVIWPVYSSGFCSSRMIEYQQSVSGLARNCDGQMEKVFMSIMPGLRIRLGKQRAFVDYHGLDLDQDTSPDAADVVIPARVIAL